jgi:hypothetical protein
MGKSQDLKVWDKDIFPYIEKACKGISGMPTRLIQARSKMD